MTTHEAITWILAHKYIELTVTEHCISLAFIADGVWCGMESSLPDRGMALIDCVQQARRIEEQHGL